MRDQEWTAWTVSAWVVSRDPSKAVTFDPGPDEIVK